MNWSYISSVVFVSTVLAVALGGIVALVVVSLG